MFASRHPPTITKGNFMDVFVGRHCIINARPFAVQLYRRARTLEIIVGRWQLVASIT
jgi:hypothetical protein